MDRPGRGLRGRSLYACRLQQHRLRTFKRSRDPAFAAEVEDVVDLDMDPPAHAVVLSIDEKSQIHDFDRIRPDRPLEPGHLAVFLGLLQSLQVIDLTPLLAWLGIPEPSRAAIISTMGVLAWMARFRRLARDDERLPATLAGLHPVAFSILLLRRAADFAAVRNSLQARGPLAATVRHCASRALNAGPGRRACWPRPGLAVPARQAMRR